MLKWEDRNCTRCALSLGCVHYKGFIDIEPPNSEYWLREICAPNDLSRDTDA